MTANINPYKKLTYEFETIRNSLQSYKHGGRGLTLLQSIQHAFETDDKDGVVYCLSQLEDWYIEEMSDMADSRNTTDKFGFTAKDHERVYSVISDLLEEIEEYNFHIARRSRLQKAKDHRNGLSDQKVTTNRLIFLSHSSLDRQYGDALRDFIIGLGVKNEQLFYTSHEKNTIPLGENINENLQGKIHKDTFMIMLLSDNYFKCVTCMNEMGAATLGGKCDYMCIFVPEFNFEDSRYTNSAIDTKKMGILLNGAELCKGRMLEFKDKIVGMFGLNIDDNTVNNLVDKFIDTIKYHVDSIENNQIPQFSQENNQKEPMKSLVLMPIVTIEPADAQRVYNGGTDAKFTGYDKRINIEAGDPAPILSNDMSRKDNIPLILFARYYYRRMTLRNIGNDSVCDINITMNNHVVVTGWSLTKNEEIVLFLSIDTTHSGSFDVNYKIDMTIEYSDLNGRKYKQNCSCEVNYDPFARVAAPINNLPELIS